MLTYRTGFLSLNTVAIWGHVILCCGDIEQHPWTLDTGCQQQLPSCSNQRKSLHTITGGEGEAGGTKWPPVKDHLSDDTDIHRVSTPYSQTIIESS